MGREEAGEEVSDTELVRELGTWHGGCWEMDEDKGRPAMEEECRRLGCSGECDTGRGRPALWLCSSEGLK